MNVDVTFLGEGVNNALVVPTVAIATEEGQTGVYVLLCLRMGQKLERQRLICRRH